MSSITISSSGVNPSGPAKSGFANLARSRADYDACRDECVDTMVKELTEAGIRASIFPGDASNSEVPGYVLGSLSFWRFDRAWYYWRAKGPGLPIEVAEKLHETHGTVCRVAGHCACPSPREWYKGFGVPDYHVDTPKGLKALADAIRSVYDALKDPDAMPYCGGAIKGGLIEDYRK